MEEKTESSRMTRRGFIRAAAGSALALAAGNTLAGCGGGNGTPPAVLSGHKLYVTTFFNNTVERYNAVDGGHETSLMTGTNPNSNPPGSGAAGMVFGIDDDVYIVNHFQDSVDRYKADFSKKQWTISNVLEPYNIAVSPDGLLYIPNVPSTFGSPFGGDSIRVFDAVTGDFQSTLIMVDHPVDVLLGPNNDLYVSTALDNIQAHSDGTVTLDTSHPNSDSILRFDRATGTLLGTVVQGTKLPYDMVFSPDGNLLVTEALNNRVQVYNPTTGASLGTFATMNFPVGLAYGLDGDLYVTSNTDPLAHDNVGSVLRFDGSTGAPKGTFVSRVSFAAYLAFKA